MSIQYYLRENKFKWGKKYFAHTVPNQIIDEKNLVEYMAGKNAGMTSTELKGVLDLLKQSLRELLTKGNRIILADILTIFPIVKASFDTTKEAFNHSSNSINVRCTVSRSLKNEIRKTAIVEKHSSNGIAPILSDVVSGKKEENLIRWPYSTSVTGKNLDPWNRELQCVRLIDQAEPQNILEITNDNLVMDTQSDKEITFSINQDLIVPEWLTPGRAVHLQVEYPTDVETVPLASNTIKTFWLIKPETNENEDTEENENMETAE